MGKLKSFSSSVQNKFSSVKRARFMSRKKEKMSPDAPVHSLTRYFFRPG